MRSGDSGKEKRTEVGANAFGIEFVRKGIFQGGMREEALNLRGLWGSSK